ncbi:MAG: hypothetical protein V3U75_04140 [Methylococcaceae bacterium]
MVNRIVLESKCEIFNKEHPVKSAVFYIDDLGEPIATTIKHPAEVLGNHTAVVWLEGVRGAYALNRIVSVGAISAD